MSPSKPLCGAGVSGTSVAEGCTVLDIGVSDSYLGDGGRLDPQIARAAGGDELDDPGPVDLGDRYVGGDASQVQGGHPVGDLEDVDHVVGDEDDGVAGVGQPADEVEHLAGLRDAQGGGRLVEDDELGLPENGLGDGDGLALAAGQAGDLLADRLQ